LLVVEEKEKISRQEILESLIEMQYERNDIDFSRSKFRVRGDTIEIFPAYEEKALRIELYDDKIEKLVEFDPTSGKSGETLTKAAIYPAKHFVTSKDHIESALELIKAELEDRLKELRAQSKLLEAQRLESRTNYDMEMLREVGFCHGIENYSRHLSARPAGSRPYCLIDYFPQDFLTIIDESHVSIPQIEGMYHGDRARKETLVEFGFRLPSALDNRPLRFDEFEKLAKQIIFVSATPAKYELERSGEPVEQIIRPTGLVDPEIEVRASAGQIDDLIGEIRKRAKLKERILVTTLTKRMAEDLTAYLQDLNLRVRYLHSEIAALERVEILRALRSGEFDCLVGINLLREGLDLPEVSLVAVLDADKEGFLRSTTSLIQVAGRAARNLNGKVLLYADSITGSMAKALKESERRRKLQLAYNQKNKITPKGIEKAIREDLVEWRKARELTMEKTGQKADEYDLASVISELEREMELAARNLQFEKAAALRDEIKRLKKVVEMK
jgi:excinuclease ABC subunit B